MLKTPPAKAATAPIFNRIIAEQEFGVNKKIPNTVKEVMSLALAHYPELKTVPIEVTFSSIKTTCQARPTISSLLGSRYKRKYKIIINNDPNAEVPFFDLSFQAQVGILGHEIAHILDYEQLSNPQIIQIAWDYIMSPKKMIAYEQRIDALTISRGLGESLHECYESIQTNDEVSEEYKMFKRLVYLTPAKIQTMIEETTIGGRE